MKSGITILRLLIICIVSVSCFSGGKQDVPDPRPEAGVIHSSCRLKNDSTFSCALYIPKALQDSVRPPCIIFFDPHSNGQIPVKAYQSLADKFGWILMGSNQVRNGMAPEQIDLIVGLLFSEACHAIRADSNRIYLGGFSGGARVATLSAFYKVKAKGIIACGAGLAGAGTAPINKADYFGTAGSADFNMNEIISLDYPLTQAGIRHILSTFSGIHEWPPLPVMEKAFIWHTINAMRDKQLALDTVSINGYLFPLIRRMQQLQQSGRLLEAEATGRHVVEFGKGLVSIGNPDKFTNEIRESTQWNNQHEFLTSLLTREEETRKNLMESMNQKDSIWWKRYLNQLSKDEKRRLASIADDTTFLTSLKWEQKQEGLMKQRLLAFLRLLFYMNANASLTSPNQEATRKIIMLYKLADPDNPEPYYMEAVFNARNGKPRDAIQFLEQAVKKGFSDKGRMNDQPEFAELKEYPAFFDLLK